MSKIKSFRVVSVSQNTNSFGLRGVVLVSVDGTAFEVGANQLVIEDLRIFKNQDIPVPVEGVTPRWSALGFEIPRKLAKPTAKMLKEVYPDYELRLARLNPVNALVEEAEALLTFLEQYPHQHAVDIRGYTDALSKAISDFKKPTIPAITRISPTGFSLFEFGYKCCEKGMNLDAAIVELKKTVER